MHKPKEVLYDVLGGLKPRLYMDIHSVSEVNEPQRDLSQIEGPAHSTDFNNE
jgi:NADH-quinone oxidoreductase subunit G